MLANELLQVASQMCAPKYHVSLSAELLPGVVCRTVLSQAVARIFYAAASML